MCITLKEMSTSLRATSTRKPLVTSMTVSSALEGELIALKQAHNIETGLMLGRQGQPTLTGCTKEDFRNIDLTFMKQDSTIKLRVYGRPRQGERVDKIVREQRGSNVTVILVISDQVGLLDHEVYWKSVIFLF